MSRAIVYEGGTCWVIRIDGEKKKFGAVTEDPIASSTNSFAKIRETIDTIETIDTTNSRPCGSGAGLSEYSIEID